MWAWFTTNSLWILIVSVLVLILLLTVGERIRGKIIKAMPEERQERVQKGLGVACWTIEGIALVITVLAFVAIVLSEEGVYAMITPETSMVPVFSSC